MSGIEGVPVQRQVLGNIPYIRNEAFPESRKEGEPDEYVPVFPARMGELSPSCSLVNSQVSPNSIAKAQSESLSEHVQILSVMEPGAPGNEPAANRVKRPSWQRTQAQQKSPSHSKYTYLRETTQPSNSFSRKRALNSRAFPDLTFVSSNPAGASQSSQRKGISFRSLSHPRKSLSANCGEVFDKNTLKKGQRTSSVFSNSNGNLLEKCCSPPLVASPLLPLNTKSSIEFAAAPVEEQLRRMRKSKKKRNIATDNTVNPPSPHNSFNKLSRSNGLRMKRSHSYADLRHRNPYRSKAMTPSIIYKAQESNASIPSFGRLQVSKKDSLDRILDSIKPLEEIQPVQDGISRQVIKSSSALLWPTSRVSVPTEWPVLRRATSLEAKSSENRTLPVDRDSFGAGYQRQYSFRTDEVKSPVWNTQSRKPHQSPFELPTFSSTNPFRHDPDWRQEPHRQKRRDSMRELKQKVTQLPSWRILDDKVRLSNIPMCFLCNSPWDYGDSIVRLPCKHVFHRKCISHWLTKSVICPLCKMSVL